MKILIFLMSLLLGVGTSYSQGNYPPYPTNSNMRIEIKPGVYNPLVYAPGWPPGWDITDYINDLTMIGDIDIFNIDGSTFFLQYLSDPLYRITPHYGKFFFDGLSDIGIDTGIVLSTGYVRYIFNAGPFNSPMLGPSPWPGIPHAAHFTSSGPNLGNGTYGISPSWKFNSYAQYPELTALNNGDSIWDANVMDFDFVPKGRILRLDYVFASEEYTNYACGYPTDVMGIFLSGPGIVGQKNIAVLPGTNTPVNPQTVYPPNSPCSLENPAGSPYFVDNTNGQNVIFNGFTTVLTAAAYVNPCDTYHLRVAVADGALHPYDTTWFIQGFPNPFSIPGDTGFGTSHGRGLYDSGLFLKMRSFRSTDSFWLEALGGVNGDGQFPYAIRSCLTAKFRVHRATALPLSEDLELVFFGSAIPGQDYQPVSGQVTIPANATYADINISALSGGMGNKNLAAALKSPYGPCASMNPYIDTATITIRDGLFVDIITNDTAICTGCNIQIEVDGEDVFSYAWQPAAGLNNPNIKEPVATVSSDTWFTVTASPGQSGINCAPSKDSVLIKVGATGIYDLSHKDVLNVFPNPTEGIFQIESDLPFSKAFELSISDVLGRKLGFANGTIMELNEYLTQQNALVNGIYFLHLHDELGRHWRFKVTKR